MPPKKEIQILTEYLASKNLKASARRILILKAFLKTKRHVTADELYRIITRTQPSVGAATVYRNLRLFYQCGLARELIFDDGIARYEPLFGRHHHDHLICIKCGRFEEFVDPEIERLQDRLVRRHGFYPKTHRMDLYGTCKRCTL